MTTTNYTNGNTKVQIFPDGTKIREFENAPAPLFPESIDIKISDYCDLGCKYCHEQSTVKGLHGDLQNLKQIIKDLPAGVELAIGGGNPLSHPDLLNFLQFLKDKGIIANLTVNQGHLKEYYNLLENLIVNNLVHGLGISITSNNFDYIKLLKKLSNNIVFHVIAGINKVDIIDNLIQLGDAKVLVLGYKQFGRGIDFYSEAIEKQIKQWKMYLPKYIGKCILSFDNLAIEQLGVKRWFTSEGWNKFYMGDDFVFTMYMDAVKQQYAPTSRSVKRQGFADCGLLEYFQNNRKA